MIRVLIERTFAPGMEEDLRKLELELRQVAVSTPGYISGESLRDSENPQHNVVISTWRSRGEWERWMQCEARASIANRLADMLTEPESIKILEPL